MLWRNALLLGVFCAVSGLAAKAQPPSNENPRESRSHQESRQGGRLGVQSGEQASEAMQNLLRGGGHGQIGPQNRQGNYSGGRRWSRGDRLPDQFRQDRYFVGNWQEYGLHRPPEGYRWYRDDDNNFFLALIATGVLSDAIYRSDRDDMWQRGYSRYYSYNDDLYYQQCRRSADPAGVLLGGLIGGLLGNAAGHGGGGATIAGVVLGGAVGAALTRNMDCEDRSYAYRSYYDGFNSGRPGSFEWRNPRNGHYGRVNVDSYYNDPYGFRCARFNQTTYIQGQLYPARGEACRQPNGSWAVVR